MSDLMRRRMANNPVFGLAKCPYCGFKNAVFWSGNMRWKCFSCAKPFSVKRQKLERVQRITRRNEPPEEVRFDCFSCGGKGTLVCYQAKSNGHSRGVCTACGRRLLE